MKITNISCTQFAGVRDRSVALTDGINVIYGKNESGKSTLVNLISRTLFQDAKLDRRSHKDFFENYFPSAKKGASFAADFADGKITFETENGTFTLSKDWGSDSRASLSTPDGVIRDSAKIAAILRDTLVYGEGVYADMLLSSQRNTDTALQTILDASKKTDAKQEITDAVSQAFAESDGISTDAIEQAIYTKIDEIKGKHWDEDRDAPVRKAGRWSNGLGEILKAYYALEDAKAVLEKISQLERDADRASADYAEKDAAVRISEEAYNRFNAFAGKLEAQNERKKAIARIEAELSKITTVLSAWPSLVENVAKAKKLETEFSDRKALDLYSSAKVLHDELTGLKAKIAELRCPEDSEITAVKEAQRKVSTLENKLCGMNLTAAIKMLGNHSIEINSLRTGELIEVSAATNITEAVSITIPGVMEMQLAPADVNVEDVERQLCEQRGIIRKIFEKYTVSSLRELEDMVRDYSTIQSEINNKTVKFNALLGGVSFEELEAATAAIAEAPRSKEEISTDISALCGDRDIASHIISNETTIKTYESDYVSVADLKAKAFDLQTELSKATAAAAVAEDIPAEFASIADPERHLEGLQNDLKRKQQFREDALREKTAAASRLESYQENISDDPVAAVEKAERAFHEQKALLAHWQHIAKVFAEQKETIADNPLADLAENFTRYLGVISGGKVTSEFPDSDKLNMTIYSSDRVIDYGKLSEGTKETVSLAFRLAVLDHLFPEGGGVAVLDDPFANMDVDRTAQSVELIKDFATRHQVIFLTCKEDYIETLNGNLIKI